MHGEREAKTEDDDHDSLIGGTPASLAEIINRELSEAPGTRRPNRPSPICPTAAGYGAHTYVWEPVFVFYKNMNKTCVLVFCFFCVFSIYTGTPASSLFSTQRKSRVIFLSKQNCTPGGTWFSSHLCCANICGRRLAQSYVGAILDASHGLRLLTIAQSFTG